ncbi:hypothetical protein LU631_15410 [Erwinia tracheiphila]|uniref:hypothetical protein n=1 Tax=Erwinia tracheiphila TaxID=65700 RepID=UPI0003383324|nr:hypothetical protein [Erwinia tracheiphila]EOS96853.1 hypothetical protein ETR_00565 [Erwinia tracheiphila PSU-1]UIA86382.1 hypothetical protein LU631_15410 [Erwinia tracheiphila]UIA94731.1 hypothetical protein LU633_13865 [Erwinia tracheiphila]
MGLLKITYPIEISDKGLIRGFMERKRNEHQEAYDAFVNSAGRQGNVIYGVKVSTSAGQFKNGSFLYITYYGTVATVECID